MVIKSLLDTDLYKLTMMQAVMHQFPGTMTEFKFKCRNVADWDDVIVEEIANEIGNLCTLRYNEDELAYLKNIYFFKSDFIDFLRLFQFNRQHIQLGKEGGNLHIHIKGPWLQTILFEVFVLSIVNEVYFKHKAIMVKPGTAVYRLKEKIELMKESGLGEDFTFSDFGTRRRFSFAHQDKVVKMLSEEVPEYFAGTSNVYLAKKYGLKAIGTMAHEWLQAGQAIGVRLVDSQSKMLQSWVDEYRGDLGIALSDIFGVDAFIRDFDKYFAKLYDGVRHDSGDPIWWARKMIDHYKSMGIDPKTKTLVFSDGLTVPKAIEIYKLLHDEAKVTFGIGTNLTNDFAGVTPLQIVLKMTTCNGQPVAKISDSPGKGMCEDEEYLSYLKKVQQISA